MAIAKRVKVSELQSSSWYHILNRTNPILFRIYGKCICEFTDTFLCGDLGNVRNS